MAPLYELAWIPYSMAASGIDKLLAWQVKTLRANILGRKVEVASPFMI